MFLSCWIFLQKCCCQQISHIRGWTFHFLYIYIYIYVNTILTSCKITTKFSFNILTGISMKITVTCTEDRALHSRGMLGINITDTRTTYTFKLKKNLFLFNISLQLSPYLIFPSVHKHLTMKSCMQHWLFIHTGSIRKK
jgi:hypothetical protein